MLTRSAAMSVTRRLVCDDARTSTWKAGVPGDLEPLHEDALRLTDQLPGAHRRAHPLLLLGAGQRDGGVAGEDQPDRLGLGAEGVRRAGSRG